MSFDIEHWQISKRAVVHPDGMVAAQDLRAAQAGAAILHKGGNAMDAAVATALALGVVEPWMCGLGGSGLAVIWLAGDQRAVTLDFQGMLSAASHTDDYPPDPDLPQTLMGFPTVVGRANIEGPRSITVPGAAAGLDHILRRFGRLDRADVAAPAIEMAEGGVAASWFTTLQAALAARVLAQDATSAAIYLPGGHPIAPDETLHIPGLADTLRRFASGGAEAVYGGPMVEDLSDVGATLTPQDLESYEVIEGEAQSLTHRGAQVHCLGAESGGTRLQDFLRHSAAHVTPADGPSPQSWCAYADGLNTAFRAHNRRIGRETEVGACTSHLSVVDREGNMVALTHTLLNRFGSGVTLPRSGLLMNNAVSYFDPRPGFPTSLAPGKRINASNMCPTIVTRDARAMAAIGASGGNYIMPAVAQVIGLMLDFGLSLEDAMGMGRLDASDRGWISADPRLGAQVLEALARAHEVRPFQRMVFPKYYACVSGVARSPDGWAGLNDPSQPVGGASGPAPFTARAGAADGPEVHA